MESFKCKICGNAENNTPLKVREMMFGLREEFPYFRCADCGCLQIVEPPKDMEKYYDADKYYSYHMQVKTGKARDWLHRLLFFLFKCRLLPANLRYLRCFSALDIIRKVKKRAAILDIGCGDGRLIQDMGVWGWKNLTGIDPFVEKDTVSPYGAKVLKQNIFEHSGQYDFIMMHHSLEHIDNQHEIFRLLNRLLKPDGALLIRIPVADGYPYRKYGASWFAIDAPRHYYLHTTKSIFALAQANGFCLKNVAYDSSLYVCFNLWHKNIPIPKQAFLQGPVSKKRIKFLKKQAKALNEMHDGGYARYIFTKT